VPGQVVRPARAQDWIGTAVRGVAAVPPRRKGGSARCRLDAGRRDAAALTLRELSRGPAVLRPGLGRGTGAGRSLWADAPFAAGVTLWGWSSCCPGGVQGWRPGDGEGRSDPLATGADQ